MARKHAHFTGARFWVSITMVAISSWLLGLSYTTASEFQITRADRQKIDAAIPSRAAATPKRPRKLLIFGLNVGYPGHGSIRHANYAFSLMGKRTGAFTSVVSNDPEMFRPKTLQQFDAVFFNNNVGNLFEDAELRQSLVDFVYGGGGMLGVHGTTVAFTRWPGAIEDWPEFGRMLGGRGANHKNSDELVVVKLDDPQNPLNAPFGGKSFEFRDEFFRVHGPYSRNRLRVLLSIDTQRTDMNQGGIPRGRVARADNDYALSWIRNYGRGRVFYCTIAHNPYVFWDPKMLAFYLGAIQFALGDLPAPTIPSARLTPAVRARERLGWRLELSPADGHAATLFETIDLAAQGGLSYVGAIDTQRVSDTISASLNHQLTRDQRRQVRLYLDDAGVRLLSYRTASLPADEGEMRRFFRFAKNLGTELIAVDHPPKSLQTVAQLADELAIRVSFPWTSASANNGHPFPSALSSAIGCEVSLAEGVFDGFADRRASLEQVFACVLPLPSGGDTSVQGSSVSKLKVPLTAAMKRLTAPASRPQILRITHAEILPEVRHDLKKTIAMVDQVSLQIEQE